MQLKTLNRNGNTILKDYTDREIRNIYIERNSYVIERVHDWGEDYGGSQHDEGTETTYEEIAPELILVKNGHFAGIEMLIEFDSYNGGCDDRFREVKMLIDDNPRAYARSGSSFSNDDHDRWDYITWSLIERPKDYWETH